METKAQSRLARTIRILLGNPKGSVGTAILVLLVAIAFLAPLLAPYDPLELHMQAMLNSPSSTYWFGTDELGRDIFSRILYGASISLEIGLVAVGLAALVGVVTGLIAGYIGGVVDGVIMRFWDTLLAFPGVFLAIGIVSIFGPGKMMAILAVAFGSMPTFARLTRAITISTKQVDFVTAERALGASIWRIMFHTILPHCITPILVNMAIAVPGAILMEAGLAYLGLGSRPPEPSWGNMLQAAQGYLAQNWTYGIFPGVSITLVVLGMNFFADALQDALDPRRLRAGR